MSNWFHRFLNPHCPHCHDELVEKRVCSSCEILKEQLAAANYQNKQLMDRLLAKPEVEQQKEPVAITKPTNVSWHVRRQMLESEDREKARLMRDAPKPIPIEELERDLDIAAKDREKESATK